MTAPTAGPSGLDPMIPVPLPQQVAAKEGMAPVRSGEGKIWYWDTGGNGEAIVLVHPNAGSGLSWPYQQPVFAKAGYRVVGYSRRNYYKSDLAPLDKPGFASEDLHDLIEHLGLGKIHMISVAAGGGTATDYALSHPEKMRTLVLASRTAGLSKGPVAETIAKLKPEQWGKLPRWAQETGPSYRAANPEGLARWIEINKLSEAQARNGGKQKSANKITPDLLKTLTVPTLLLTGNADYTAPPSMVRIVAGLIPNSELVIVPECGHSIYWEQPELFNRTVLDFLKRHGG
jgi:pimeloyl-ACP methyl ester carboxylesterase